MIIVTEFCTAVGNENEEPKRRGGKWGPERQASTKIDHRKPTNSGRLKDVQKNPRKRG